MERRNRVHSASSGNFLEGATVQNGTLSVYIQFLPPENMYPRNEVHGRELDLLHPFSLHIGDILFLMKEHNTYIKEIDSSATDLVSEAV